MALIKRGVADSAYRGAVTLDLGDVAREAARIKADARAEAERIVTEAKAERERLIGDAAETGQRLGHAAGHEDGLIEGREKGYDEARAAFEARAAALVEAWERALSTLENEREALMAGARRDIVDLAAMVVERIARRAIACDRGVLVRTLEEVLETVRGASGVVVRVSPEDEDAAREVVPALLERFGAAGSEASVRADGSIEAGGCVVTTRGGGEIDALVETQVERLVRAILPDADRRGSAASNADQAGEDRSVVARSDDRDASGEDARAAGGGEIEDLAA